VNLDRIKKSTGERVQLRPAAIELDAAGRPVPTADHIWIIGTVTDEWVEVSNTSTRHFTKLGKDHIHHYTTNPDGTHRTGVHHGFFTLNVQIYIRGNDVTVTPTARPGEAVTPNDEQASELVVDLRYPSDSGLQTELSRAGYRIAWVAESRVARLVNLEGWSVVVHRAPSGKLVRYRVRDRPEDKVLIQRPNGAA
jgi:hypothetical protein